MTTETETRVYNIDINNDHHNEMNQYTSDEDNDQLANESNSINNQLKQHFIDQQKTVLFIINPASGAGNAINVFEKKVVPLLKQNQIKYEVVVTTRQGSAFKYLKNIDQEQLYKWSGIVVVSGDGLLFEVFNSLMSRFDWRSAIKIPIGIIPGGSGNGLSYSISHATGDTKKKNQIISAAENVISGKQSPLDLIRVTCDRRVYYAFLSIGWGLLSDIDIESESLRLFGGHRFTIWAVVRALGLRKYSGKLKFKLLPGYSRVIDGVNENEFKSRPSSISSDIQFNENDQVKLINYIIRKEERGFLTNRDDDQLNDDDTLIEEIQRILNDNNKNDKNDKMMNKKTRRSINSLNSSSNGSNSEDDDRNDDNNNMNQKIVQSIVDNGIQNGLIESEYRREDDHPIRNGRSTLNSNSNDQWITVKGDFVMVYAVSTSHISSDCHFAPGAKLDDGIIWLLFLKGDIGRREVVKFLLNLEKGNHVKLPFVHLVPVSEFHLESYSPTSKFTVDGELVNTTKVHCETMPSIARIMCK